MDASEFDKLPDLKDFVKNHVKPERFAHSLRTAETCKKLCMKYGLDQDAGLFAGTVHDMCKDFSDEELLELAAKDGKPVGEIEVKKPALLHGRAAAVLLKNDFGINDEDVLEAVSLHTFGGVGMCGLSKVLYVADKIEPGRPHVNQEYYARLENLTLNELVRFVLEENISYIVSKGKKVAPETYRLLESIKD
ncbi:MAG: bis(5'-nucleosyl)-tetraphosphatase (symmetrical) YqeK [Treponemataceae bacterium]|nr:bis(5'-nucleosyl)-tetraphosphatase (symmetrical) YqeK [Treponemataceae bacterium]